MKKYIGIYALACVMSCLAFISCEKEEQKPYDDNALYLPIADMDIYPLGETVEVSFTSMSDWSVENTNSWIEVQPSKGEAGTTKLTLKVAPYLAINASDFSSEVNRSGNIIFNSNGNMKSYTVSQDRVFISISDNDHSSFDIGTDETFAWTNIDKTYTINSNVYWRIDIDQDQNHFDFKLNDQDIDGSKIYGNSENEKFSIKANGWFDTEIYNASFTIQPCKKEGSVEGINLPRTIKLNQENLIFIVSDQVGFSPSLKDITEFAEIEEFAGSNKDFYAYCEESVVPECYSNDTGLSVNLTGQPEVAGESNDGRIIMRYNLNAKFTKANNSFDNSKTLTCKVRPKGSNDEAAVREISFVQDKYLFEIKEGDKIIPSNTECEFESKGGTKSFTLTTEGKWKVQLPANWVEVSRITNLDGSTKNTTGGMYEGSAKIIVDAELNDFEAKVSNLTFTADNEQNKVLKLSQPKFELKLAVKNDDGDYTETSFRVSSHTKNNYQVQITSSGEWLLECSSATGANTTELKSSGTDKDGGYISFNVNKGTTSRDVTLKLYSKAHGKNFSANGYPKTLKITQDEMRANILDQQNGTALTSKKFIAYNAQSSSFYLECSAPWILASKPDWLTLSYANGNKLTVNNGTADGKYYTINMSVANNTSTAAVGRSQDVVFKIDADGNGTYETQKSFNVKQDAFEFWTDVSDLMGFYPIESDSHTFKVVLSNGATPLIDKGENSDWLVIKQTNKVVKETATTYTYTMTFEDNLPTNNGQTKANKRSLQCTIGVADEDYKSSSATSKTITIEQEPFNWAFAAYTKDNLQFAESAADSQTVTVATAYTYYDGSKWYDVYLDEDTQWLSKSGNTQNGKWTFKTKSINTDEKNARTGTIKFIVKHDKYKDPKTAPVLQTIDVSQSAYTWEVSYSGKSKFDAIDNNQGTITIKSSGDWKAEKSTSAFITLSRTSGKANKTSDTKCTFTVAPNYSESDRSCDVTISTTDGSQKSKKITIQQAGYVFKADKTGVTIGAKKTDAAVTTKITCTGGASAWTFVTPAVTWLTCEKSEDTLTIKPNEDNNTGSARSVDITINVTGTDLTKKIKVTQSAKQ